MTSHIATHRGSAAPDAQVRRTWSRRRRLVADLLVVACWASAAVAVAVYLATGSASFATRGAGLTTLGVVAALIGTDLILVMIVLAARIPLIDRAIGHDKALELHRRMGKPALYLLLAHGVLLTAGYAASADTNLLRQIALFIAPGDVLLGVIALVLLVLVVISSLVAVRRRFAYELWHLIHVTTYVAVLIAVPHQLSAGIVFSGGPAQVYWIALYVIAFGAVLVFRIIAPIVRTLRHAVVVEHVERIAPDAISIHLRGRDLGLLNARGGQFFVWRFWTSDTWWHAHPISLSAAPTDRSARITIRELGAGTSRLAQLPTGTPVSFAGPYGLFTDVARTSDRVAIFASGIGVTPARALLEELAVEPDRIMVFVRASQKKELYLWNELSRMSRLRGLRVYGSIGPRASGDLSWMSQDDRSRGVTMRTIEPSIADCDVYICGPDAWGELIEQAARQAGVPATRIHREHFAW